jgi:hypothetical protein
MDDTLRAVTTIGLQKIKRNKMPFRLAQVSNNRWATVLRTSLVYTDSFLMLSGVLTSFNMSKEIERKKHIDWIMKYVARFVRYVFISTSCTSTRLIPMCFLRASL